MIAGGDRPKYRLRPHDDGWAIDALSWVTVTGQGRRAALEEARAAIAAWLGVAPEAFDLEA